MHLVALSAALVTFSVVLAVGMKAAAVTGDAAAGKDELDGSSGRYTAVKFFIL